MKKMFIAIILIVLLFVIGCSTNIHTIGNGPQKNDSQEARQWYILYGLVPLNEVNTHEMAGNAIDYEIKTEQSFLDGLISCFTSAVSVTCRTVTVTK
ncbi:MAG: hypothetical protein HQ534_13065 [Armatimonadetes bacterium]|nr:hypothetical protein [Armatimonadota bacterium]